MRHSRPLVIALFLILFAGTIPSLHADNLIGVYSAAERNFPQLKRAKAAQDIAEQRRRQAMSGLLPQANLGFDVSAVQQEMGDFSGNYNNWGYSLNLDQTLYNATRFRTLAQTNSYIAQAQADYEANLSELMLNVAERYFELLAANDNLDFARAEKEAIARQLDQTKQRFDVGLIAITDVHEAQAAYDQAVAQEIAAENSLSSAREALRELTDTYPNDLAKLKKEIPLISPEPADIKKWIDTALSQNLRLLSTQFTVDAARQQIDIQRAGHHPTVGLYGRYDYSDNGGARFNNQALTTGSVGIEMNVPLFSGFGVSAQVSESQAAFEQAKENLEEQRRAAHRQTSDAYLNIFSSISRVKALEQAVISTQSALSASEAGLEVGTRTTVDVLNTRRELFRAQRDHARARYDYLLNTLRLKLAAGQLNNQELQRVNALLE